MSTPLVNPIFTQERLDAYLDRMAPHVCNGRCVEIRAKREREEREYQMLTPEEKEARCQARQAGLKILIDNLKQAIERLK